MSSADENTRCAAEMFETSAVVNAGWPVHVIIARSSTGHGASRPRYSRPSPRDKSVLLGSGVSNPDSGLVMGQVIMMTFGEMCGGEKFMITFLLGEGYFGPTPRRRHARNIRRR